MAATAVSPVETSLESIIQMMVVDPRATVSCAVQLGIFSALEARPATAAEVEASVGLHPAMSADFLDALVGLGLLHRDGDVYQNSAVAGEHLGSSAQTYMGEFIEQITESSLQAWAQLGEALRTGQVQRQSRGGFAGGMNPDPGRARRFMATMDALNGRIGEELAHRLDWSRYRTFADLGGARGNLAAVIARAWPQLRGICVDLPTAANFFDEHVGELGLTDRVRFLGANLFTDPLPAADVLIYGQVLHGYGNLDRKRLLARAAEVLPPDGLLIIYDRMIDDDRRDTDRLLYSLYMRLVSGSGSEYRAADCAAWLREAGLSDVDVRPLLDTHTLVTARR